MNAANAVKIIYRHRRGQAFYVSCMRMCPFRPIYGTRDGTSIEFSTFCPLRRRYSSRIGSYKEPSHYWSPVLSRPNTICLLEQTSLQNMNIQYTLCNILEWRQKC